MRYSHLLIFAFLFSYVARAQDINVHIVYADGRAAGPNLRVRLMSGGSSTPVSEIFTNGRGEAAFYASKGGIYHVVVSGDGIEEADSGGFEVETRNTTQQLYLAVLSTASTSKQTAGGPQSVSAVDLNVPKGAKKEFDEGNKAMASQDWAKAIQRLERAIAIYPQYALAYNNIGVAYGRMNEPAKERAALEKAIGLNDHFVPAYLNLAKMSLREQDAARAETLLESALRAEPQNVETMTLLVEAQLLNKQYDAAIDGASKVHALPHQNFAVVHYIAARAYERQNQPQGALAELQIFLTEEPNGARADHVREEITQIKKSQP
jgi:tetratricopeptide (TPR) repeat protein